VVIEDRATRERVRNHVGLETVVHQDRWDSAAAAALLDAIRGEVHP